MDGADGLGRGADSVASGLPLEGLKVLDVSGPLGAYCCRLLGDLGADVVKIEPPSGDRMRRVPPFSDSLEPPESSLVFAAYNANKRGITLDTACPDAEPVLEELAATADAVVISPSRRAPLVGFDRDRKAAAWMPPHGVLAALTPFGLDGPWRDHRATPLTSFALSGGMLKAGSPNGPPLAVPGQAAWDEASLHAALGVLAALLAPRAELSTLDLSVHEVAMKRDFHFETFDARGEKGPARKALVGIPPSGVWHCRDGMIDIAAHQRHHWAAFLEMLDHPPALSEPSLADPVVRQAIFDGLRETIAGLLARWGVSELTERGQKVGLPCSPCNQPENFVRDVQSAARELFTSLPGGGAPSTVVPWRWHWSEPALIRLRRPAPMLGQHNVDVYVDELGHTGAELLEWRRSGLV